METYSMINFFGQKERTSGSVSEGMLDPHNIPRHVAIIMDGNGRWAKRKGLPRSYGHRAGADTLKRIVIAADDLGIKVLTVYAFSTENWKRPDEEVSYIMKLMKSYLNKNLLELKEHNVRLHVIGDMKRLHPDLQEAFAQAEADMAANTGLILNVAVNYGGRLEITQAARSWPKPSRPGRFSPKRLPKRHWPSTCIRTRKTTWTCSSVPVRTSGSAISSCGRWPMPSSGSPSSAGPISPRIPWSKRFYPSRAGNGASAA